MEYKASGGPLNEKIKSVTADSRKCVPGSLFVAIKGVQADGHKFIEKAIQNGATTIVGEEDRILPAPLTYVQVADSHKALGEIAARFYDHPSQSLQVIGITGTNGKTTVATLLHQLIMDMGWKAGLISTVENRIGAASVPATHTTPNPVELQSLLRQMANVGCSYVFMEVSSHAVDQQRIAGVQFAGAVFTNLTQDHLDYHQTFKAYLEAKKQFFDQLSSKAFALTNLDDRHAMVMLQNTKASKYSYSLKRMADFKGKVLEKGMFGMEVLLNDLSFFTPLIGDFNASNLTAVYGVARLLGFSKESILVGLSKLKSPEGRLDYLVNPRHKVMGVVDYAHTPDALDKVLRALGEFQGKKGGIITVFGCGGDRDRDKRPKMAAAAERHSKQIILTNDNPRTENPEQILQDMMQGVQEQRKALVIPNRKEAIKVAVQMAKAGDIILVAGKGHEKYQEINGDRIPFDDKAILQELLN